MCVHWHILSLQLQKMLTATKGYIVKKKRFILIKIKKEFIKINCFLFKWQSGIQYGIKI